MFKFGFSDVQLFFNLYSGAHTTSVWIYMNFRTDVVREPVSRLIDKNIWIYFFNIISGFFCVLIQVDSKLWYNFSDFMQFFGVEAVTIIYCTRMYGNKGRVQIQTPGGKFGLFFISELFIHTKKKKNIYRSILCSRQDIL